MVYRALNSRRSINLNFEGGEWLRNCMDRHWQIKIVFDINVLLFYVQSVNPAFHLSNAWVHNLVVLSPRTRTGGDGDGGGGGCLWWDFSSFFWLGFDFSLWWIFLIFWLQFRVVVVVCSQLWECFISHPFLLIPLFPISIQGLSISHSLSLSLRLSFTH